MNVPIAVTGTDSATGESTQITIFTLIKALDRNTLRSSFVNFEASPLDI